MLKISPFQQSWLNHLLAPLTVGVALVVSGAIPVTANPIILRSQPQICSSIIYGSPIPSPVPVNPVTGTPCSFSSNNYPDYNYRDYNYRDYDYGYDNSTRNPVRGTIRNSTLINPTIIDSTISDSVLIDPTIINSSRYNRRVIIRSNVIQRTPGITIHIGK
ncbi:hypothetical protein [Limnofasciculus baicalensis]|uniref:Uncharacterized protein n=1 Tax=Limnofasciculus baicalensis BBK-W-15 TaxID=2699891 RepID=A0AAE3GX61_9CYAN|nr:hypothetical protein [Limnofasciculus baicalensis]MCP2731727.1 hypothetical protein [Limnofasciculus baicalensis BBK-W-15]